MKKGAGCDVQVRTEARAARRRPAVLQQPEAGALKPPPPPPPCGAARGGATRRYRRYRRYLPGLEVLLQDGQALGLLAVVGDHGAGALDDLR